MSAPRPTDFSAADLLALVDARTGKPWAAAGRIVENTQPTYRDVHDQPIWAAGYVGPLLLQRERETDPHFDITRYMTWLVSEQSPFWVHDDNDEPQT
jgi:hypothetical protein